MHTYHVTLVVHTTTRLTQDQQDTMREEILRCVDEEANLPLDADCATASVVEE